MVNALITRFGNNKEGYKRSYLVIVTHPTPAAAAEATATINGSHQLRRESTGPKILLPNLTENAHTLAICGG